MAFLDNFHYKISGQTSGEKLVFLHGLMGYWANWRGLIPAFESKFHILAYDQRGHGRSMKPETGYAPENYADDLHNILNELGWEKVNIIGHSMGGRNALNFSFRFPHRIKKLVIEDIGPDANKEAIAYFEGLLNKVPTPFSEKRLAKEFLYNSFNPVLGSFLYSNIEEKTPGSFDWRFKKEGILSSVYEGQAKERWDEFRSIKCPTLLIRGEKSQELSKEVFEKAKKENPNIQGVEVAEAGHWVHFEKPQECIQLISKFLN